ncbi:hypothetical protein LshimejAT787_0210370 [Lyophyllum shimeji]|uniref:Uncharacterized protein n=1 Tax=Lyophyllum shimeji TaxID=47721 RepID=A0A9P3UJI0_LYOSH|nr:hypothetical protein LshimejAT787_0210370 [Lyophyllum shimeji]
MSFHGTRLALMSSLPLPRYRRLLCRLAVGLMDSALPCAVETYSHVGFNGWLALGTLFWEHFVDRGFRYRSGRALVRRIAEGGNILPRFSALNVKSGNDGNDETCGHLERLEQWKQL